ncbi:MAG TPA: hypothetical protein VFX96_14800 [Pyrinomonadaceae bacterium]|nr:hypothetical protein [Pyrinomonadaceae bacterium]
MSSDEILRRLRLFLLVLSVALMCGAVVELLMVEHTEDPVQLIPFALCGLGAAAALAALARPRRATMWALRIAMALVVSGTLLGVYLHLEGNMGLQRELSPNAPTGEILWGALSGGNPLLAPGILSVAALLALAATYKHPALDNTAKQE